MESRKEHSRIVVLSFNARETTDELKRGWVLSETKHPLDLAQEVSPKGLLAQSAYDCLVEYQAALLTIGTLSASLATARVLRRSG
jgi:hypothetical protein